MKPSYRKRFVNAVKRGEVAGLTIDPDNPALAYDSMELGTPPGTRVRFTGYGGHKFQQAGMQRCPPTPIEYRRMEYQAAQRIAETLGVDL